MRCTIDLTDIKTRGQFHDRIMEALPCPSYYGRNMDALYDILTDWQGDLELSFRGFADFSHDLPGYGETLRELCEEVMEERQDIRISFEE